MSKKIKVSAVIGEKVEESEIAGKKIRTNRATPPEGADVEAQSHIEWHICGWCGAAGYAEVSDYVYNIYHCHNCGSPYRA